MNETFEASNGISVMRNPDDGPDIDYQSWSIGNAREVLLAPHEVDALREFFQYERDQELGRWRWPENPDYVVYQREVTGHTDAEYRECTVLDERSGVLQEFGSELPQCHGGYFREAARAYFAAHPQSKPWMEVPEGVYAMRPNVHLYERLIMFRGGKWHHLYKHHSEESSDPHSDDPEKIAEAAFREGRLTRLVAEVSDA